MLPRPKGIRTIPIADGAVARAEGKLSFFEDPDSLEWRYFGGQYVRISFDSSPCNYVIAKRGSKERYVRVCQWHLDSDARMFPLINALVALSRKEKAIGVRWAVYGNGSVSERVVKHMRKAGFFCRPRVRTVMVHNKEPDFLDAAKWNMNDSLFSFDP
jgi:hypothetical protein